MRQLTETELEQSENGLAFSSVTAAELFGPASNYDLSARVQRSNPARYRELKAEWAYISGAERRPDSFYK